MDEHASYAYYEDVNWGLLRLWGKRANLRVLDVGCGFATTSERIQKLGNEVTGIESSALACEMAAQRIARVIEGDLATIDLGEQTFDAIIFADVLEHLPWPVGVLQRYLRWLAPNGSVFVSLPNVGLWSVRLAHLAGRWDYADTGVLDRTHLRFFTRRSARWLLDQAGLAPVRTTYNPGIVRPFVNVAKKLHGQNGTSADPRALLHSRSYQWYLRTVYPLERGVAALWPGMLAFQMISESKRAS
ncbi:MAG TPA: class I SAM-dependent methyltransferase [Thermoanaerobaculia bacterium]|nr:class I SAM-dependent methyltransferase [Thermoanaerobaculia bacterium]